MSLFGSGYKNTFSSDLWVYVSGDIKWNKFPAYTKLTVIDATQFYSTQPSPKRNSYNRTKSTGIDVTQFYSTQPNPIIQAIGLWYAYIIITSVSATFY